MRKKYFISLLSDYGELKSHFETDSPKTALNKWFSYALKSPTMANICCGSVDDCMALYSEFLKNREEFHNKYWRDTDHRMAYKYDYFVNTCMGYLNGTKKVSFSARVYPFCYG